MKRNFRTRAGLTNVIALAFLVVATSFLHGQPPRGENNREGLVLIGYAQDKFALAVDSASANADGTVSEVQKIFPVGKRGAILFAGPTSIQDPVDRPVRQQLNIVRIVTAWLDAHPDAELATAHREIKTVVSQALTSFFAQRKPTDPGRRKFSILLVGFSEGKPVIMRSSFRVPSQGAPPIVTSNMESIIRGLKTFGADGVATKLIRGGDRGTLQTFAGDASLLMLHHHLGEMTSSDYLKLFDVLLRASESPEGKRWRNDLGHAAPPDRFAILTAENGLQMQ